MSMMMMQRSLSVPLLLLLFCSLSGAKSLSEGGDAQESSALQQVSDAQEARMRQKRDAEEDKTYLQQNGDSVALELRLRQQSDLSALRKLLEEQRKLGKTIHKTTLGPL